MYLNTLLDFPTYKRILYHTKKKQNESINKNVVIDCSLQFSFAVGCCEFNLAVKMHERSLWNWTSNTDTVWSFYMEEKIDYFIGVFINKLHGEETERQSCFDFRIIYGFARFQYNRLALCWNILISGYLTALL